MEPQDFLNKVYDESVKLIVSNNFITSDISEIEKILLDNILKYSEQAKGILTVCITSIVYKAIHPSQDIRNHQNSIIGGYSGRTFDTRFITPFLKSRRFPAMAESGWLTRSLEQKVPYDKNYTGAIKQDELKTAFIEVLDKIQNGANCELYLQYLLQGLILKRNQQSIELAKPTNLSIKSILDLLNAHFNSKYHSEGASRLPVFSLKYYLRLLDNTYEFVENYVKLIETDTALKFEHKEKWNRLISEL